jgi:hypothetical protein
MKTTNPLRNAALTLILVLTASFSFSQSENKTSDNLNREKTEFANAGYWIDAVVVNPATEKSDRELFASNGYYIEPVVVVYDRPVQDYIDAQDGTVSFAGKKALEDLEVSMLNDDKTW